MTALQLFKLFITVEFVEHIFFPLIQMPRWSGEEGIWGRSYNTNVKEIFAFISYFLIMKDFVALPYIHQYFTTEKKLWFLHSNNIGKIFSRHRFTQLKRYFQVSDPKNKIRGGQRKAMTPCTRLCHWLYNNIRAVLLSLQKYFNWWNHDTI